ncbi:MAG: glycosyltransferase family 39 protein [Planctomycetota bacterium]
MPEPSPPAVPDSANPAAVRRGWIAVFAVFLGLFAATANRGAQWQDPGHHILRIVTGQSINPLGLALSHPLHHWLGRLAVRPDVVEPCFAITLLSALAAAVAVANLYGIVLALTRRRRAAVLAAVSLGLANTFWQLATLAETYTLGAALLTGECWCLVKYAQGRQRKHLWTMLLLNGLGISNHLLALLTTPVLVFILLHGWRKREIRGIELFVAAVFGIVGTLPYGALIAAELVRTGDIWGTARSALFGHYFSGNVMNTSLSPRILLVSVGFVGLSFPNLLLPAAAYGLARARSVGIPPLARRALAAELILHAAFTLRYNIADPQTFLLPLYALLCMFGGVGFAAVGHWRHSKAKRGVLAVALVLLTTTPVVYAVFPPLARHFHLLRSVARNKPYRDDYIYLLVPWSVVERSAERMSREAVEGAGEHGLIVVEDSMAAFAVRYRALRAGRSALEIICPPDSTAMLRAIESGRPVILVPANAGAPSTPPPFGSWQRAGDLYLWTPAPPSSSLW